MSNGSALRRTRDRAARRDHAHAGARPHAPQKAALVPAFVAITAPLCDCLRPQRLLCCTCCGSMSWACPKEPVPRGYTCVAVKPADTFADLLDDQPAAPPTAAAPATA